MLSYGDELTAKRMVCQASAIPQDKDKKPVLPAISGRERRIGSPSGSLELATTSNRTLPCPILSLSVGSAFGRGTRSQTYSTSRPG